MNDAPTGETLTYIVDGVEKLVHVRTNILCDRNLAQVASYMKAARKSQRQDLIQDLKSLPAESASLGIAELVKSSMEKLSVSYDDVFEAIQNADGKALRIVLSNSTDADVDELMQCHDNVLEILASTITAGMSAFEAIEKNLSALEIGQKSLVE